MKIERSEAEETHMERHRVRKEELVASHDTVKLLKVEARRANLISMALSGKDDDGTRSDRARDSAGPVRVTRLSTCPCWCRATEAVRTNQDRSVEVRLE